MMEYQRTTNRRKKESKVSVPVTGPLRPELTGLAEVEFRKLAFTINRLNLSSTTVVVVKFSALAGSCLIADSETVSGI